MSDVLGRIDLLEKTRLSAPKRERIEELYVWPGAVSLALLFVSLLGAETVWLKVPA